MTEPMISAQVATTTTTDVWARSIGVRYTKAIAEEAPGAERQQHLAAEVGEAVERQAAAR